ncbi:hypothetical protein NSQ43_13920 [Sporosarcina sp. FSL W8-0480]|uniref:hypothetical protein n=1 Tax=Sporosarcina sp. FSL W8-0480 TaxID=2954701 RepID=UPI0030DD62EF
MGYITGILIVGIVMCVPITAIITDYKRKTLKFRADMVRDEIELEKVKQQNFIIETEKMKLELEQMKLDYTSGKNDIMKI